MKIIPRYWLIAISFLLLNVSHSSFATYKEQTEKQSSLTETQFSVGLSPPLITGNASSPGFLSRIVQASLINQQYSATINILSWPEAERNVDSKHHLSYGWHKSAEREKKWLFSSPVYEQEFVFLARKDVRFYWQRYDQLRAYHIGISGVQSYGPLFDGYIKYLTTTKYVSDYSALNSVVDGKVDAILIEKSNAKYLMSFLDKSDSSKLQLLEDTVIHKDPIYLVCAKSLSNCNELIDVFNLGLKQVKSSNKYEQSINSFFEAK